MALMLVVPEETACAAVCCSSGQAHARGSVGGRRCCRSADGTVSLVLLLLQACSRSSATR
jgi:hypothetical protein